MRVTRHLAVRPARTLPRRAAVPSTLPVLTGLLLLLPALWSLQLERGAAPATAGPIGLAVVVPNLG